MQEVAIHRFASAMSEFCAPSCRYEDVGVQAIRPDRAFLENYIALRDYYEHLKSGFRVANSRKKPRMEIDDGRSWRIIMELPIDKPDEMIEFGKAELMSPRMRPWT